MARLFRLAVSLVFVATIVSCGGAETAEIPVDADGFPTEWPIAVPPGSVATCDNGQVSRDSSLFSIVLCLPSDPDPFSAAEQYLAELESDGFAEREPGSFIVDQQTYLDGNGIEIFYQLIDDQITIVLINPAD